MIRFYVLVFSLFLFGMTNPGCTQSISLPAADTSYMRLRFHGTWTTDGAGVSTSSAARSLHDSDTDFPQNQSPPTLTQEAQLPITPFDSLICFNADGTYWVNDPSNAGQYKLLTKVAPALKDAYYTFRIEIAGELFALNQHKSTLSIGRGYDSWGWTTLFNRVK